MANFVQRQKKTVEDVEGLHWCESVGVMAVAVIVVVEKDYICTHNY